MHKVVTIEYADPFTPGNAKRSITRRRRSAVDIRLNETNTAIFSDQPFDDSNARIGRCVIRNDDLNVAKSLTARRANRIGNELLTVIICDNDANFDYRLPTVLRLGHAASNSAHIRMRAVLCRRPAENFSSHEVGNKADRKPEMHGHRGDP